MVEGDRTRPKDAALFAINMLTATQGGRTYTEAEIRAWGEQAGFRFVACERLSPRSCLLTLRKDLGSSSILSHGVLHVDEPATSREHPRNHGPTT